MNLSKTVMCHDVAFVIQENCKGLLLSGNSALEVGRYAGLMMGFGQGSPASVAPRTGTGPWPWPGGGGPLG